DALLVAGRADDPPVLPLRGAERADERTLGAVPQRPQNPDLGPPRAERADRRRARGLPRLGVVRQVLGVGLEERPGEEGLARRDRRAALAPEFVEHLLPAPRLPGAELGRRLRQGRWSDVPDIVEERGEPGEEEEQLELVAERSGQPKLPGRAAP